MAEELPPPIRSMNFVSEEKKQRKQWVSELKMELPREIGCSLSFVKTLLNFCNIEILKESKDKRDAEFSERFKHRPPKALDEDETEFIDKLESKREYEQQMVDEEAQQLRSFQAAVATQAIMLPDPKTMSTVPVVQEQKPVGKKNSGSRPLSMIIIVKPQTKKARTDAGNVEEETDKLKPSTATMNKSSNTMKMPNGDFVECHEAHYVAKTGVVSYSDESEDDD